MKLNFALLGGLLATSASAFHVPSSFRTSSLTTLSALSLDESSPRDVGSFDEWCDVCQVQKAEGFQLTSEDGLDWSVMTTTDIPEGTPVLCVPSNMVLSARAASEEMGEAAKPGIDYLAARGAGDQAPQFYLFLKMLLEYENGDQSPYFPWLNALPRLYYNSVSMTQTCYECLPPLVFSLSRIERLKYDNFVDAIKEVDFISESTKSDTVALKWAFNVVRTRRIKTPEGDKQIVPMADMFNHGTETEIDFNFDEEGNLIAYATKDIPAGSPLRYSYGDPTNPSRLFAKYGFLDETSPATFCKIMSIKPNDQLLEIGYDHSKMLFYKDTGDISEEVWDIMLYHNLASNQAEQQAFYTACVSGDADTKAAYHSHYFLETATALKKHVDDFLKQLDDLQDRAAGKDINEHPRLPLIMNHNEFVKNTFLMVKSRLDPMVAEAQGAPVMA